ncbi:MAG: FAD-dependent oxidoreductase [Firmicutes bacterium]|nr:FAD-dependent oxidoreductase [Bacillota bacterium]
MATQTLPAGTQGAPAQTAAQDKAPAASRREPGKTRFDVIVVGAGPAGVSAAITAAKAGLSVLILERGDYPGSKNVMGGVLYRQPTDVILPGFWREAPLERHLVEQGYWLMSERGATKFSYRGEDWDAEPYNAFTVLRARFDRWYAQQAEKAGAILVPETTVDEVLVRDGQAVGVRVGRDQGEIYANVVILADGVNSLLAKSLGLHQEWEPHTIALAVKEIIALPREKIESRFQIEGDQGVAYELLGSISKGMVGIGFLYTNKDTISIGMGCMLSDFARTGIKPYELLDQLKQHPAIKPVLAGGETREYMAHLIPEGGYNSLPKLYMGGLLVVGDAAQFVNALTREGSNMAMISGHLAAMTAIRAHQRGDFSAASMAYYRDLLENSFILQDLRRFRKIMPFVESRHELITVYPELLAELLQDFYTVDSVPKTQLFRRMMRKIRARRRWTSVLGDLWKGLRALS